MLYARAGEEVCAAKLPGMKDTPNDQKPPLRCPQRNKTQKSPKQEYLKINYKKFPITSLFVLAYPGIRNGTLRKGTYQYTPKWLSPPCFLVMPKKSLKEWVHKTQGMALASSIDRNKPLWKKLMYKAHMWTSGYSGLWNKWYDYVGEQELITLCFIEQADSL